MKLFYSLLFTLIFAFSFCSVNAQSSTLVEKDELKIYPVFVVQLWSTYTLGTELYNEDERTFEPVDDRLNFQLRRSRIGLKGQFNDRLKFNFTVAADFIGGDIFAGTEDAANNGPSPSLRMWNAWVQWKAYKDNESVNVTFGYFPPRIGRESMNPALAVSTMDKAWSQNYLRRHLVGTGPGRSVGLNIGGLLQVADKLVFEYDLGVFNPLMFNNPGTSGITTSPLTVGRVAFSIGDPETEKYALGKKVNYFGKRNGLSIGVAGAYQAKQLNFENNMVLSFDLMFNYGHFNLDGDVSFLTKEAAFVSETPSSVTGYIRASYNFPINDYLFLTPTISYVWFDGESEESSLQNIALLLGMPSGNEQIIETGIQFYFYKKYKLNISYTFRAADPGQLSEADRVNNYYRASNGLTIKRGDWIGIGLVATI